MSFRGNPVFSDVLDAGTRWIREQWEREVADGLTDLGWTAWAREQGMIVSGNPTQWDDIRRVNVSLISQVVKPFEDGGNAPGGVYEPVMRRITPLEGKRRRRRRRPAA